MFVAFVLAAAALQAAEAPPSSATRAVPVAPPIVHTPLAPPPVITPIVSTPMATGFERSTVTIAVRATQRNAVLLDDRFRVGRVPATYMQSRSEPANEQCSKSWAGLRSHVSLGLRPDGQEKEDRFRLSFSWSRPNGPCETDGVRGVNVEQPVVLKPGAKIVVEGDGGLQVELSRL